jgi:hypothetical protein
VPAILEVFQSRNSASVFWSWRPSGYLEVRLTLGQRRALHSSKNLTIVREGAPNVMMKCKTKHKVVSSKFHTQKNIFCVIFSLFFNLKFPKSVSIALLDS